MTTEVWRSDSFSLVPIRVWRMSSTPALARDMLCGDVQHLVKLRCTAFGRHCTGNLTQLVYMLHRQYAVLSEICIGIMTQIVHSGTNNVQ